MTTNGESFLPRIQSVFYAVFDLKVGPKIVYQVPESLIAVSSSATVSIPSSPSGNPNAPSSRNSSISTILSPLDLRPTGNGYSSLKRPVSTSPVLFHFDEISKYVIPHSSLCGRLVTCTTRRHKIIGFPAVILGEYERNYLRYNVCFVFDRSADLSCYEPVVRKISRVLKSCEEESAFLSSPETGQEMAAIIEQLYEDLNSYSETSIPIDRFNSIELKIFPFYPNPLKVKDWQVPLALINLNKRAEPNWDLTMVRVCQFIDGTNHISRIARLADCDLHLVREVISHLLYYQVIMMVDIFQYSNMYCLQASVQWLAEERHVADECGPYVTKPGKPIPDWPTLLHLYSRLKSGTTVLEWMKAYDVHVLHIDVRRFTSFGVIKGFLRRIHRWPVFQPDNSSHFRIAPVPTNAQTKRRRKSIPSPVAPRPIWTAPLAPAPHAIDIPTAHSLLRSRSPPITSLATSSIVPGTAVVSSNNPADSTTPPNRRMSAAENILEQLRAKDIEKTASGRTSWAWTVRDQQATNTTLSQTPNRRPIVITPQPHSASSTSIPNAAALAVPQRPRLSRSPSAPLVQAVPIVETELPFPRELLDLLDGEHHSDDICDRFQVGWPVLEQWLATVTVNRDGEQGKVTFIYR